MYKKLAVVAVVMALAVTVVADEQWIGFSGERPWSEAQIEIGKVFGALKRLQRVVDIDLKAVFSKQRRVPVAEIGGGVAFPAADEKSCLHWCLFLM